ncbi:ATP-dependent zinc metalloprotease FtsH [Roseateles sp.]|uniref:ATP-dependent zinc metalloprotease FtsH n=1 Tax=Roseateles sp. TaxID=1971397 RepID=UPI00345CD569
MPLRLQRPPTWLLVGIMMLLWLAWVSRAAWQTSQGIEVLSYSAFEDKLRDGEVSQVTISDGRVVGELKIPDAQGHRQIAAELVDPGLAERLSKFGVNYQQVHESTLLRDLLSWIAPFLVLMVFWSVMARRAGGLSGGAGLMGVGQSKARLYNVERNTGVRFEDVAGVDEAKAELRELVEFLKDPERHGRLGARVPKGVLLVGPTGTGKTLLARAVAGEAGVAFLTISGSEFIELFVGVGAARVRDLFEQARANAPAIIFIDELDALGKVRSVMPIAGGHEEREQTLNQLLVELDGFDPSVGVVLLAATNRPEILDPALLRSGRFDRQVLVDRPDRTGRLAILKVHARKIRMAAGTDLEQVAAITVGLAGADLANVVNEAALTATRRGADAVELADFTVAIERLVAGIEKKSRLVTVREREWVATHELGHAFVALMLPSTDPVHKVSIVPRGMAALGYTLQRPSDDRHLMRKSELTDKLAVLLGGRAAEIMAFGEPSTGAADDLAKATDLARDMVLRFGMDDRLGPMSLAGAHAVFLPTPESPSPGQPPAGARTTQRVDEAVHALLEEAQARATALLSQRRGALERGVKALMAQETLDEAQLKAFLAAEPPPAQPPVPAAAS